MKTPNLNLTLALALVTSCKVQSPSPTASTRTIEPTPIAEPAPIADTTAPSLACLGFQPELNFDSRLIYNPDHDRYMIRFWPDEPQGDLFDQLEAVSSLITDRTVTIDDTIDLQNEEDFALALHVSKPFTTDLLITIDSVNGTNPEELNPNREPASDDTVVHWGTTVYIVGEIETLIDILGYDNPECQP